MIQMWITIIIIIMIMIMMIEIEKVKASNYGVVGFGFDTSSNELLFTPTSPFSVQVNLNKTLENIVAGKTHYITIENKDSYNMLGWGENQDGQIGLNISSTVASLDTLPLDAKITKACAGDGYSVALGSDNKLYTWGTGNTGQLGAGGSVTSRNVPGYVDQTGVLAAKTISDMACGTGHVLILNTDNSIAAFGLGTNGQLGNDDTTNRFVAVMVSQLGHTYTHIAAGGYHSLAISKESGTQNVVYSFGKGTEGQLGRAAADSDSKLPQPCYTATGSDLTTNVKAIAAGKYASAALTNDGKIITWGQNTKLVLGHALGTTPENDKQAFPIQVDMSGVLAGKIFKGIFINCESYHMVALDENENLYTWGDNTEGQLGYDISVSTKSAPISLPVTGVPRRRLIREVKTNGVSTLLLSDDNIIYQTGGYLPTFYTSKKSMFGYANENVFKNQFDNSVRMSLGDSFAVIIDPSHNLWSWGENGDKGLLGIGKTGDDFNSATFQQINHTLFLESDDYPVEITTGTLHTVMLSNKGLLYSWGDNAQGQLGINSVSGFRSSPTAVSLQDVVHPVAQVCSNSKYTIVVDEKGYVFSFGFNPTGELAQVDGSDVEVVLGTYPQAVKNVSTGSKPSSLENVLIQSVSCGTKHVLAISTTGVVHAWGDNLAKQLGLLTTIDSSPGSKSVVPVLVNTTLNPLDGVQVTKVAAGKSHSVALIGATGKLITWGSNAYEQLGIPALDAINYYRAQEMTLTGTLLEGKTIDSIFCGDDFTLVRTDEKFLYSFGRNNLNQLGNLDYQNHATPVQVRDGEGNVMANVTNGISSRSTLTVLIVDNENPICFGVAPDVTCSQHGDCIQQNNCSCQDFYYGEQCEHFTCNGKNESDTSVCSTNGICRSAENCDCYSKYWGGDCQHFLCYGKTSDACNLQGQCTGYDQCICNSTYTGDECQYPFCYSIPSNDSTVCSGNGQCTLPNQCQCNSTYIGSECDIPLCYNIGKNESSVCSGHGECMSPNNCTCTEGYTGDECEQPICFDIRSGNSSVCSSHGACTGIDHCNCQTDYSGLDCSIPICYGVNSSSSSVCSGKGNCVSANQCVCQANSFGPTCNLYKCDHILSNETNVCNGHGVCNNTDICICNSEYTNQFCQTPLCYGIAGNNASVCSGQGSCNSPNDCTCNTGNIGDTCDISICYSILGNDTSVCNMHGNCSSPDNCTCRSYYSGDACETVIDEANSCFGFSKDDKDFVCSGHGTCVSKDTCLCESYWFNAKCDTQTCFGIYANDSTVCNGHGNCTAPDVCTCESGFGDTTCNSITCFGTPASQRSVCSGHGTCTGYDQCQCNSDATNGYWDSNDCSTCDPFHTGSDCKTVSCTDATSCSAHGTCAADQLSCNCFATTNLGFFNGTTCDQCADYYLNYATCTEKCKADTTCSKHGQCLTSGACQCHQHIDNGFFQGTACKECSSPYRGSSYCQTNFETAILTFNNDGTHLILSNGTYPTISSCDVLVSSLTKIGMYPSCDVNNTNKEISIRLGANATIVPTQVVQLFEEPGSTTTINFTATAPTTPTPPTLDFYTKATIGKCESIQLDGSLTTSKDGRALTYEWTSPTTALNTHFKNQPTISIPDSDITAGTYQFTMKATTFLNAESTSPQKTVTVLADVVPVPDIKGGVSTFFTPLGKSLSIEGIVSSSCVDENHAGSLSYKWKSLSGPENIDSKLTSTTTSLALQFSTAGTYQIEFIVATDAIAGHEFTKRVIIHAQHRPLVSIIAGESKLVPASQTVVLNGDSSYDPDAPTSYTYSYAWSCYDDTTKTDCTNMITNKFISTTDIGANRLLNNHQYTITLKYADGVSRVATDSITIETDENAGLIVSLGAVPDRVNANDELTLTSSIYDIASSATIPLNSKEYSYTWFIQKTGNTNMSIPLDMLTTATSNLPIITFVKNSFVPGITYQIGVRVQKLSSSVYGKTWTNIVINIPPQQGQVTINPTTVKSLQDSFSIVSTQWSDPEEDTPLRYRVSYAHPTTKEVMYLTTKSLQSSHSNLQFPVLSFTQTLTVTVQMEIYDQRNALSTMSQSMQVSPYGAGRADILPLVEQQIVDLEGSLDSLTFSAELQKLLVIAQNLQSHEERFCETSCSSEGTCNIDVSPNVCVCNDNKGGRDCSLSTSTKNFAIALKERAALLFSKVVNTNTDTYAEEDSTLIVHISYLLSHDTDEVTATTYSQISWVYNKTLTEQTLLDDGSLTTNMPALLNNLMESVIQITANGSSACDTIGSESPLELFLEKTMSFLDAQQSYEEAATTFTASAISIRTYKSDFTALVSYQSYIDASKVANVYVNHSYLQLPGSDLSTVLSHSGFIDINYAVVQVNPYPCSSYPTGSVHVADFVFIGFYDNGIKLTNVKNLPSNITFAVPLNADALISTESKVVESDSNTTTTTYEYVCRYYNGSSWSSEGCSFVSINSTHGTCACDHTTLFSMFIESFETVTYPEPPYLMYAMIALGIILAIVLCWCLCVLACCCFVCCLRRRFKTHPLDYDSDTDSFASERWLHPWEYEKRGIPYFMRKPDPSGKKYQFKVVAGAAEDEETPYHQVDLSSEGAGLSDVSMEGSGEFLIKPENKQGEELRNLSKTPDLAAGDTAPTRISYVTPMDEEDIHDDPEDQGFMPEHAV